MSNSSVVFAQARAIVEEIVYSIATTVGPDGRPRSRVVHPVWLWNGTETTGFVTARPTPLKRRHLDSHPVMTCGYWSPQHHTAFFDCDCRWLEADELEAAWHTVASTPPPLGFDPSTIWPDGPGDAGFAVLELRPYRVQATMAEDFAAGRSASRWSRVAEAV